MFHGRTMRNIGLVPLFALVFVLLTFLPGPCLGIPLEEIVAKVQDVYQRTKDLKADFTQESTLKSLDKTQTATGEIYFKNPGKLRWDYNTPTKQEIVTNGETLWMYIYEDRQVVVSNFSEVYQSNTSAFFLSGMGDLKRDFHVRLGEPTDEDDGNSYVLRLIPREQQSNIEELFLLIDKDSFLVVETYFHDFYGNLIRIRFKNHKINRGLQDSMFIFKIPDDVDVIEQPSISQPQ